MTMNNSEYNNDQYEAIIPLDEYTRNGGHDLQGAYDPSGETAYGANNEKIGKVRTAMVEQDTGRIRYLLITTGGMFNSKEVLVPVGMARIEDDAVYFDNLTRDQITSMSEYRAGQGMDRTAMASDERALTGRDAPLQDNGRYDYRDHLENDRTFATPQKLRLLEERLLVDKRRENAGSVEVGKRVETVPQRVDVNLSHDEVVIERHPVTDARPTEAAQFGADAQTIRLDLEEERADVRKQAFVAEEVDVSKRQVNEQRTVSDEVRRERLDVRETGDVEVRGDRGALDDRNDKPNKI